MSKIFVCQYENNTIECKKVYGEESDLDANRFAQKKAGGVSATPRVKIVRDGSKIFQLLVFSKENQKGYFCLSCTKPLALKKNDIEGSISALCPDELINFIKSLTGASLENKSDTSQVETNESCNFDIKKWF